MLKLRASRPILNAEGASSIPSLLHPTQNASGPSCRSGAFVRAFRTLIGTVGRLRLQVWKAAVWSKRRADDVDGSQPPDGRHPVPTGTTRRSGKPCCGSSGAPVMADDGRISSPCASSTARNVGRRLVPVSIRRRRSGWCWLKKGGFRERIQAGLTGFPRSPWYSTSAS